MSGVDVRQVATGELDSAEFPPVSQELRIHLSEEAFDKATARGEEAVGVEVGGVLVGRVLKDSTGPFVRVDAIIDALHAEEKGAELTFTHKTWDHVHAQMDERYREKKIVGWFHTHPGFGVFLSDRDLFIHQSFFDLPFQIAVVYDPKTREHGVFAWREGKPTRVRRYWVGEREHLWDDARTEARTEPTPSNEPPRSSPPTAVPRGSTRSSTRPKPKASASEDPPADDEERTGLDWRFMGVAAVALAVAAGFGGWWFGSRRAQAALEMVAVEQQKARVEGARGAIKELDHELLGILRQTLGNEPLRKRIDEARGDLDALEKLVTTDAEREKVAALRAKLGELTDGRADATKLLALLEAEGNAATLSPAQITAELGTLRSALGALYADLAAESTARGDAARAERMLVVAISVDPANTSRYEAQRAGKKDGSQ